MYLWRKLYYYLKRIQNGGKPCCDELVFRKRLKAKKLGLKEKCETIAKCFGCNRRKHTLLDPHYKYNGNHITISHDVNSKLIVTRNNKEIFKVRDCRYSDYKIDHIYKFKPNHWMEIVNDLYEKVLAAKKEKAKKKLKDKWDVNTDNCEVCI